MLTMPSPRKGGLTITQDEIESWYGLRSQIKRLRRKFQEVDSSIRERLEEGAPVEPGIHTAELRPVVRAGKRFSRIVIS